MYLIFSLSSELKIYELFTDYLNGITLATSSLIKWYYLGYFLANQMGFALATSFLLLFNPLLYTNKVTGDG
jgi:hypothetical protein